jgi:hypothetical protein
MSLAKKTQHDNFSFKNYSFGIPESVYLIFKIISTMAFYIICYP